MHPNPRPKDWAGLLCFIMASDKRKFIVLILMIIMAITRRRRIRATMLINLCPFPEKTEATGSEVNGVETNDQSICQNLEDLVCDTKAEDVTDVIKEGVS